MRTTCASLLVVLLVSAIAFGQAVTGTLLGTITDPSGAVVPNAKVSITETRTGISRSTAANESGHHIFVNLPPGKYNVSVDQKDVSALPGAKVIDRSWIFPGPDSSIYAFTRETVQRNLYRIPLP